MALEEAIKICGADETFYIMPVIKIGKENAGLHKAYGKGCKRADDTLKPK